MAFYTTADLANKNYVAKLSASERAAALSYVQGSAKTLQKQVKASIAEYDAASKELDAAVKQEAAAKAEYDKTKSATAQAAYNKSTAERVKKQAAISTIVDKAATVNRQLTETEQGISNLKAAGTIANPAQQGRSGPHAVPAQVKSESIPAVVPATVELPVNIVPTVFPDNDPAVQVVEHFAPTPITIDAAVDAADAAAAREAEYAAIEAQLYADAAANDTNRGLTTAQDNTRSQADQQNISNFNSTEDWRVRLSLAENSNYLYTDPNHTGILDPLKPTNGVVFPYTPAISVSYAAQYETMAPTHSNYKIFSYSSSSVDQITLGCDFTAQDVFEANYLLAVIHFFRSVTKMFYGQDNDPKNGTPPPLCYLTGLGAYQFDSHPLVVTGFTYTLPTDVDYIRAGVMPMQQPKSGATSSRNTRLESNNLNPGGTVAPPVWTGAYRVQEPTYVPTKIQLSITASPIITRQDISSNFSLRDYATGALLRKNNRTGGGIW